jgi:hypothetical protein
MSNAGTGQRKRRKSEKTIRLSVSLPTDVAAQIESIAGAIDASASKAVLMLVREGLRSREQRHAHLTSVVNQLQASTNTAEQKQLASELGAILFPEIHAENPVGEATASGTVTPRATGNGAPNQRRRSPQA